MALDEENITEPVVEKVSGRFTVTVHPLGSLISIGDGEHKTDVEDDDNG